jgi:hypothetical protein
MKSSRERFEEYAAGIDKALRRAAKRAALTAAATGTRLIIYEKDRIKRLRPLEVRDLPRAGKNLEPPRARQKQVIIAENRTKYGSR